MITSSKYKWIFTRLGICIDIMEVWFGIANGQISSIFDSYLPDSGRALSFHIFILFLFVSAKQYWYFSYFSKKIYALYSL